MNRKLLLFLLILWGWTGAFAQVLQPSMATKIDVNKKLPKRVDSMAALRAYSVAGVATGESLDTLGYYVAGDGGGGTFVFDPNSAAAVVPGMVEAPISGGGRWLRSWKNVVDVRWCGAVGDGVTDDSAAINAAMAAASSSGDIVVAKGVFAIASTITIQRAFDGREATFNYTGGSGTAIIVRRGSGATRLSDATIYTPAVRQVNKPAAPGWLGGDIGVQAVNVATSHLHIGTITDFSTGFQAIGIGSGFAYNHVHLTGLINNKINLHLTTGTAGWCNENTFHAGRFQQYSNEGSNIPGCRHILLDQQDLTFNGPNNNVFLHPSIEGNGPEYHVEVYSSHNLFVGARWESAPPKVRWSAYNATNYANRNTIFYGYDVDNIEVTKDAASARNSIYGPASIKIAGGGAGGVLRLSNQTSSTSPVMLVGGATEDPSTDPLTTLYSVSLAAQYLRGKRAADTEPRVWADFTNGRLYLGPGAASPPVAYLQGLTSSIAVAGGNLRVDVGLAQGGGLKHQRTTTGSIAAGATSDVTLTWTAPFADADYSLLGAPTVVEATGQLQVVGVKSKTAASVVVSVRNNSAGALTGNMTVAAAHD